MEIISYFAHVLGNTAIVHVSSSGTRASSIRSCSCITGKGDKKSTR